MTNPENLNILLNNNLDLIEEALEENDKAVCLFGGASSSGKSHISRELKKFLGARNLKSVILSTDDYNKGISGIVTDKVNEKYYDSKLPNIDKIKEEVKNRIIDKDFDQKFTGYNLMKIWKSCNKIIPFEIIDDFLLHLKNEFKKINFDEPSVYNLEDVAKDVKKIYKNEKIQKREYSKSISEQCGNIKNKLDGNDYDVIIVEGIYALNEKLTENIKNLKPTKNFIEGNQKDLFLRRLIRDAGNNVDNEFTARIYFDYVYPGYKNTILPTKKNADILFKNKMSFEELRNGKIISKQQKLKMNTKKQVKELIDSAEKKITYFEKDLYIEDSDVISEENNNLLRLRLKSKDGKKYKLSSLVHKGQPKLRKDKNIIRPVNVLLDEKQLNNLYKDESEILSKFESLGFKKSKELIKQRTKLYIDDVKLIVDYIEGQGVFVEYNPEVKSKILEKLSKNGKKCNSFYELINSKTKVKGMSR